MATDIMPTMHGIFGSVYAFIVRKIQITHVDIPFARLPEVL